MEVLWLGGLSACLAFILEMGLLINADIQRAFHSLECQLSMKMARVPLHGKL